MVSKFVLKIGVDAGDVYTNHLGKSIHKVGSEYEVFRIKNMSRITLARLSDFNQAYLRWKQNA